MQLFLILLRVLVPAYSPAQDLGDARGRFPEELPKQPLSHTLAVKPAYAIGVAWAAPQEIYVLASREISRH